jgi:L-threonylcarbamoyladenylate synthase
MTDIASILLGGGVVLMPTDTIYGLHALADHPKAIQRIVDIKGRGEDKPFVVIGSSIEQLEQFGATFSKATREILESLWPGPLTAIVPLRAPVAASRGASSIAVRVPALDSLRELLERTGPLASTSVNRSGEPVLVDPKSLSLDLHDALDAIVDAGPREGEASTIVDFTGNEPRLIRNGETFFTQKVWKTLRKSL